MWICLQLSGARGGDNGGVKGINTCIKAMVSNTKYNKVEIIILVSRRLRKFGVLEPYEVSVGT